MAFSDLVRRCDPTAGWQPEQRGGVVFFLMPLLLRVYIGINVEVSFERVMVME